MVKEQGVIGEKTTQEVVKIDACTREEIHPVPSIANKVFCLLKFIWAHMELLKSQPDLRLVGFNNSLL